MANAKFIVGQTGGQIDFSVVPSTPSNPSAGYVTAYSDGSTFQVIDSSGNPLIIGQTGAQGPAGATGAQGPAGATGAGASSPITREQTNSLVSTAIGATATVANAIVIGATASSNNNSIVIGTCAKAEGTSTSLQGGVVIGNGACLFGTTTGQSIAIGPNSCASGIDSGIGRNSIAIGQAAVANSTFGGVAIGVQPFTNSPANSIGLFTSTCSDHALALGVLAGVGANSCSSVAIGSYGACVASNSPNSFAIGRFTTVCSSNSRAFGSGTLIYSSSACSTAIGQDTTIFPGATGAIVLGSSSVGGTGACDSIVLGNSSSTVSSCTITIGSGAISRATNNIVIGRSASTTTHAAGGGEIAIGWNACSGGSIRKGVALGACSVSCFGGIAIGEEACSPGDNSIAIGAGQGADRTFASGEGALAMTYGSKATATNAISIGRFSCATASGAKNIGAGNVVSAACGIVLGSSSTSSHTNAVVLGHSLTSERSNTVHVDNLIAYGQAASKTNAIGDTGGTVTINWNNSNVQTLTLTSSISSLTKSNPIDGAVYTVFITQGGTGSNTIAWGSDVKWPGGTGPTLSTAVGATDVVNLVYIAGITGYYGNSNSNF